MIVSIPHMSAKTENNKGVDEMFKAGAHYGFVKSRRHPSVKSFIFGTKNRIEIFDLEKTEVQLNKALEYVKSIAELGKTLLFVSSKSESKEIAKKHAESINAPYVSGRWIGGTFTNFTEIKRRIEKLLDLRSKKEKGELKKYTKKEQLLIDREMAKLTTMFDGLTGMNGLPSAIFVIDSKKEHIAVAEAREKGIPVIALCGADCDISIIDFPIVCNDATTTSIEYFVSKIAKEYSANKKVASSEVKK